MAGWHVVRAGALGTLGRYAAIDGTCYPRDARVIVRTARGLEVGRVLVTPAVERRSSVADESLLDGRIVRGMTVEDELLQSRLVDRRGAALDACQSRLNERGVEAALLDVEHLFDGQTLVFYFLGPVTHDLEAVTAELAEVYESRAQVQSFADVLEHGCGPGCGTEAATGGGCTNCGTGCAVAQACAKVR